MIELYIVRLNSMKHKFLSRMEALLGKEYEDYLATLEKPMYRGLRVNTLKVSVEDFQSLAVFPLEHTPFCKEAFYIPSHLSSIGNHPYHIAGLFYVQEPSATSAVEVLDVKEGEWVLDLCAAPGGKSSQIGAKLNHTGFLVSNEIDSGRANVLLSNMERMGISENMITNAYPDKLCEVFKGHFHKVLVDAPCSGEGMFKKHSKAMEEWSQEHVLSCRNRQLHILDSAYKALRKDGILVYSTCTYAQEENEEVVYTFLQSYPDMELVDCRVSFGREGIAYKDLDVTKVRRIFPMDKGEGHFIAKFRRKSENTQVKLKTIASKNMDRCVNDFLQQHATSFDFHLMSHQDKIYACKQPFFDLKKIKVLRQGILCGEVRKQRFEPHQHFYMAAIIKNYHKQVVSLDEQQCVSFMQGNMLSIPGYKGFVAIAYHSHIIGFGKGDGNVIKNKFPKGLRCTISL